MLRHFRKTAVLHWFLGPRLVDPGAGREEGGVSIVQFSFLGLQINSKQSLVQFPGSFLKPISHRDRRIIDHTLTTDLLVGQVEI